VREKFGQHALKIIRGYSYPYPLKGNFKYFNNW
jgi:hypothetical protein